MVERVKAVLKKNNQPIYYAERIVAAIGTVAEEQLEQSVLDALHSYRLRNEDL